MRLRDTSSATVISYALALAVFVAATVFFGWAGVVLGVVVLALVKLGRWAVPLIKLSYAERPPEAEPKP